MQIERSVDAHSEVARYKSKRSVGFIASEEIMPLPAARFAHIEPAFVIDHLGSKRDIRFGRYFAAFWIVRPAAPFPIHHVIGFPARNFAGSLFIAVKRRVKIVFTVESENIRIAYVVHVAVAVVKLDIVVVSFVIAFVKSNDLLAAVRRHARCGIIWLFRRLAIALITAAAAAENHAA